jgi:hypothetical protein
MEMVATCEIPENKKGKDRIEISSFFFYPYGKYMHQIIVQ